MKFSHEYEDEFFTLNAYKNDISIWFKDGGVAEVVILNGDQEFDAMDDALYGIMVMVDDEVVSLDKVRREAEKQYEGIIAETNEPDTYDGGRSDYYAGL